MSIPVLLSKNNFLIPLLSHGFRKEEEKGQPVRESESTKKGPGIRSEINVLFPCRCQSYTETHGEAKEEQGSAEESSEYRQNKRISFSHDRNRFIVVPDRPLDDGEPEHDGKKDSDERRLPCDAEKQRVQIEELVCEGSDYIRNREAGRKQRDEYDSESEAGEKGDAGLLESCTTAQHEFSRATSGCLLWSGDSERDEDRESHEQGMEEQEIEQKQEEVVLMR